MAHRAHVCTAVDVSSGKRSFRLLPGTGTITHDGDTQRYHLTADTLEGIVLRSGYGAQREVPVDFEHTLYYTAMEDDQEEGEYAEEHPGENLAAGHVRLRTEEDGVWADVVSWTSRAARLLKEGAVRYVSPVIRGFGGHEPRITSLALTNVPAIDEMEPLVLRAEPIEPRAPATVQTTHNKTQTEEETMDLQLLAANLGIQADVVATSEDKREEQILSAALALRQERDALQQEKQQAELETVIASARESGQLTEAMEEWARGQTVEALKAWAQVAPVVVATDATRMDTSRIRAPEIHQEESPEAAGVRAGFEAARGEQQQKKEAE